MDPLEIFPEAERLNQLGERKFADGCYPEALNAFRSAHQLQPDWVVPLNNMGVAYWHARDYLAALTEMRKAYQLDPFDLATVQNLSDMMVALGKKDTAFSIIRTYLRKYPDDFGFQGKLEKLRPEIRIIHHMARSGGTIVCKCLGCMDKVLLLSEIHPKGAAWFDPMAQAHQWFGLFNPSEIHPDETIHLSFLEKIARVYERTNGRSQHLVIRDWSHLDFTAVPFVKDPTYQLTTALTLGEWFEVKHIATVRHPIDQWLSLRNLAVMKDQITLDQFLYGYRKFAEKAHEIGFVRYEDFIADPTDTMKTICDRLKIPFDKNFLQKWYSYHTITGDMNNPRVPKTTIDSVPRRPMEPGLKKRFENSEDYRKSIEILGYTDS